MEPWVVYSTGHEISERICERLHFGLWNAGYDVKLTYPQHYDPDFEHIPIFYGILRGTGDIIKRRWEEGKPFVYVDHGYMGRGHYDGYYRMVWNRLHPEELPWEPNWDSLEKNNWQAVQARKTHGLTVIAQPSDHIGEFIGFNPEDWTKRRLEDWGGATVTRKGDGRGQELARSAALFITYQSSLAVEALRHGSDVKIIIQNEPRAALTQYQYTMPGGRFRRNAEGPNIYLAKLAATQFTLDEIATGKPFKWLERYRP